MSTLFINVLLKCRDGGNKAEDSTGFFLISSLMLLNYGVNEKINEICQKADALNGVPEFRF